MASSTGSPRTRTTAHFIGILVSCLLNIAAVSFADNPPTTQCMQYLNGSEAQFIALMASGSAVANTALQTLAQCQEANVCSALPNIDSCAATLSTRVFISGYYAYLGTTDGNSDRLTGMTNTTPPTIAETTPILPPVLSSTPPNTSANNGNGSSPNTASPSSIHWF